MRSMINVIFAILLFTLIGCGDSSTLPEPITEPVSKTFSTTGLIIALSSASVQIGSTNYNVSKATITLDGNTGNYSELRQGMVVTVKGTRTIAKNQANTVNSLEFKDELEGPISSIDLAADTFIVLGVQVQVNELTLFESITMETLMVGNIVEVSGFQGGDGTVIATLVELKALSFTPGDEIEVKGTISTLNEVAQTFFIGLQLVDYSEAIIKDVEGDILSNGLFVEVKSTIGLVDGVLIASEVEREYENDEADEIKIEGIVTVFNDATDFEVNGQAVTTNNTTQFENGGISDIQIGVQLEVEGELNADGVLVAEEIEFKISNDIKIEATVSDVNTTDMMVTVLGITVQINSLTLLKDDSTLELEPFTLSDLNVGDFVEIGAFLQDGLLIAGKLERGDLEEEVVLKGFIDSLSQPDLVIMGVSIITDSNTEFEDAQDNPITADIFFSMLLTGDLVEVEGVFDGSVFIASEAEIETED